MPTYTGPVSNGAELAGSRPGYADVWKPAQDTADKVQGDAETVTSIAEWGQWAGNVSQYGHLPAEVRFDTTTRPVLEIWDQRVVDPGIRQIQDEAQRGIVDIFHRDLRSADDLGTVLNDFANDRAPRIDLLENQQWSGLEANVPFVGVWISRARGAEDWLNQRIESIYRIPNIVNNNVMQFRGWLSYQTESVSCTVFSCY